MARHKDGNWNLPETMDWERVNIAVLMDIRDELKRLNNVLHCNNFLAVPFKLDQIVTNTTKKKRKRKRKAA